jgi:LacI family transcriptional regulator
MSANLKKIAERVGVSTASVSIYLSDPETRRVSSDTKKKIDKAAAELNYRKNLFASSLSRDRSMVIGILVPTNIPLFQNDYTNLLLSGVQKNLAGDGYSLLFFPSSASSSEDIIKEQLQQSAGCDGYVLFSTGFCSMEHIHTNIRELTVTGKPFVTLNVPEVDEKINQVLMTDLASVRGLEYLMDAGHRRILLILGRRNGEHMRLVNEKYRIALEKRQIPIDHDLVIYGNYSEEDTYRKVTQFLASRRDITAICCMSDLMAASALSAVKSTGLVVPKDISIIGRNNSIHSRLADPPLTTLDLDIARAGEAAAELLLESIRNSKTRRRIRLDGRIIVRSSVNERTADRAVMR